MDQEKMGHCRQQAIKASPVSAAWQRWSVLTESEQGPWLLFESNVQTGQGMARLKQDGPEPEPEPGTGREDGNGDDGGNGDEGGDGYGDRKVKVEVEVKAGTEKDWYRSTLSTALDDFEALHGCPAECDRQ